MHIPHVFMHRFHAVSDQLHVHSHENGRKTIKSEVCGQTFDWSRAHTCAQSSDNEQQVEWSWSEQVWETRGPDVGPEGVT